ncbi:MAG: hypothetical protein ACRD0H_08660 [Actinomycetes bacterium]
METVPVGVLGRKLHVLTRPTAVLLVLLFVSNAIPGVALFLYFQFLALPVTGVANPARASHVAIVSFVCFLAVALPAAGWFNVRLFRPISQWRRAGRQPTPGEQLAVLHAPVRVALLVFAYWAVGAAGSGVLDALLGYSYQRVILVVVSVLLAAIASCSLSALLTERVLRPVTAQVLAGDLPAGRRGIRVLPRLLFSWAFG